MYPDNLKLGILESKHSEYVTMLPVLKEIDLLTSGGYKLKSAIKQFIPQRPGEEGRLYEHRLSKFTYLNILSSALNDIVAKTINGSLVVSKAEKLASFREDTSLNGRSERDLLQHILRTCLKYKSIYLHVDKSKSDVIPLNKAQEEALNLKPYVITYSPFDVVNWSESGGRLQWIKVRQVIEDSSNPVGLPVTKVMWTFIDGNYIARYVVSNVTLKADGSIEKINNEAVNDDTSISLASLVNHNFSEIPVVKLDLPSEFWFTDQASAKALEHLRTDCSKHDLLTMAYFQRTFKRVQTPDADLDNSFVDNDSEPLPTGLQHVIEVEKFEWSEPQGHIIPHLMDALKQIENQVKTLISQGGASVELGAVAQSGESKRMDFSKEETLLRYYGQLLCTAYQKVLKLVAKSIQVPDQEISVTGLSEFDNDSLELQIGRLTSLSEIDFAKLKQELPTEAFKLIYAELINKAVGNISADQQKVIKTQIEAKINEAVPAPLDTP